MEVIKSHLKKIEIVSPAGGWEQLIAAINAGADAVYIGYKKFGARAYADNFDFKLLKKAVNEAHTCGVKIYLTLNTLIKDIELPEIAHFLEEYTCICNDGIIIQDMGIYRIVEELFPGTRVHASTQMNTHNSGTARFLSSNGFARVVLAREMTLDGIKNLACKSGGIELEVFAHGSQCYSYSGHCYFSSFTGSRSGNRGRCSQPCRMKYSFGIIKKKEQTKGENSALSESWSSEAFYLSKNDLLTLDIIPEIVNSGVTALKIEGRMKTAEYTGIVTSVYRKYIDLYYNQPDNYIVDDEDKYKITQIFSREASEGYFTDSFPENIISPGKAGNIGNFLGRIESVNCLNNAGNASKETVKKDTVKKYMKKTTSRHRPVVSFTLSSRSKINIGDIIGVWTNRGNEEIKVASIDLEGEKNNRILYRLNTEGGCIVGKGDRVFKLYDKLLDEEAGSYFRNGINKKKYISGTGSITVKTMPAESFRNRIGNKKMIEDYLNYYQDDYSKVLSAMDLIDAEKKYKKPQVITKKAPSISAEIYNHDNAENLLSSGVDNLVLNDFNGLFKDPDSERLSMLCKKCKKNNSNLLIKIPEILYDDELQLLENRLESLVLTGIDSFMVSNTGVFEKLAHIAGTPGGLKIYLDHSFNIFNHLSLDFFNSFIGSSCKGITIKGAVLSVELSLEEINMLIGLSSKRGMKDFGFSVYSYGFYPVMQSRFKIDHLKKLSGLKKSKEGKYFIRDQKGYMFRVVNGYNENLIYLNSRKICNFFDLPLLLENGIRDVYIDTRTFNSAEILNVISSYKKAIQLITSGNKAAFFELSQSLNGNSNFSGYTRGHLFRELI